MYEDEVITEVWRNREAYAQAHHHSLAEMIADLRRREKEHPERLVDRRPKRSAKKNALPD